MLQHMLGANYLEKTEEDTGFLWFYDKSWAERERAK